MQNKFKVAVTASLAAMIVAMPLQLRCEQPIQPRKSEKPDETWVAAACIVAFAGVAMAGIYIVSKRCQPQYYWLMDPNEEPPKFWVGNPTKKECQVNGWKRIGGPYTRLEDAPQVHPDPTNRVQEVEGPRMRIVVQHTTNMVDYVTIHEEDNELEEFIYWPTNSAPSYFRLMVTP